jgi:hypothetical protein
MDEQNWQGDCKSLRKKAICKQFVVKSFQCIDKITGKFSNRWKNISRRINTIEIMTEGTVDCQNICFSGKEEKIHALA